MKADVLVPALFDYQDEQKGQKKKGLNRTKLIGGGGALLQLVGERYTYLHMTGTK